MHPRHHWHVARLHCTLDPSLQVTIGDGPGRGMAWGCDLSYDYVKARGWAPPDAVLCVWVKGWQSGRTSGCEYVPWRSRGCNGPSECTNVLCALTRLLTPISLSLYDLAQSKPFLLPARPADQCRVHHISTLNRFPRRLAALLFVTACDQIRTAITWCPLLSCPLLSCTSGSLKLDLNVTGQRKLPSVWSIRGKLYVQPAFHNVGHWAAALVRLSCTGAARRALPLGHPSLGAVSLRPNPVRSWPVGDCPHFHRKGRRRRTGCRRVLQTLLSLYRLPRSSTRWRVNKSWRRLKAAEPVFNGCTLVSGAAPAAPACSTAAPLAGRIPSILGLIAFLMVFCVGCRPSGRARAAGTNKSF